MSRQSMAPPRSLSLTEELEKLEQSITLTLQEIDHNFSRAHRIVTTGILPIVENYGKHSEAVWEGSKFWKQFFEASANVSLSGYEAPQENEHEHGEHGHGHEDEEQTRDSVYEDETVEDETATGVVTPTRPASSLGEGDVDDSLLDSPSLGHSTPHAPALPKSMQELVDADDDEEPHYAGLSSPYEALRDEMEGGTVSKIEPATPGKQTLPDMMGFDSSPFVQPTTTKKGGFAQDPLMHRVLDKTYRVQATPIISPRKYRPTGAFTPSSHRAQAPAPRTTTQIPKWDDSSPPSSPAPQLRADIFSPMKMPRTPGVSVQTPAKGRAPASVGGNTTNMSLMRDDDYIDYSDDDDELDLSPPKTIQFHVPQTQLLQTPAREASRRIVDELLQTAGGDFDDTLDEDSPSVVRRQVDLDDSF